MSNQFQKTLETYRYILHSHILVLVKGFPSAYDSWITKKLCHTCHKKCQGLEHIKYVWASRVAKVENNNSTAIKPCVKLWHNTVNFHFITSHYRYSKSSKPTYTNVELNYLARFESLNHYSSIICKIVIGSDPPIGLEVKCKCRYHCHYHPIFRTGIDILWMVSF